MILLGLFYLTGLAAIITLIFRWFLSARGPWGSFWTFFTIVLLAILASDLWIGPIGPYYADVYWLPPLIVGVLIAFLLAATTPPGKPLTRNEKLSNENLVEEKTSVVVGRFFWFLIVFLFILILLGFLISLEQQDNLQNFK